MPFSFSAARAWVSRTGCGCLLVMTLLCLVLRENYPFSQFPMYSSFSRKSYYLYLTTAQGEEIPTQPFALSNSGLRKIYDSFYRVAWKRNAKKGDARRQLSEEEAGRELLRYLAGFPGLNDQLKQALASAQVRRVDVFQEGDRLRFQSRIAATNR